MTTYDEAAHPVVYTVPHLAKALQCSERTVWSLVLSGQIPSVKIGALRRVTADQLDRYLASLEAND